MMTTILVIFLCYQIQHTYTLSPLRAAILLAQYGYMDIPPNIVEQPNALMIYGDYREAIKKLQRFYKLPVNGLLTPKVKKLLTAKRCGNPDLNIQYDRFKVPFAINSSTLHRNKRFVIDDQRFRWHVTDLTWRINSYPLFFSSTYYTRFVFTQAFNFWSVNSGMNFREELNTTKKVDIVIVFGTKEHGKCISFDGPGGTLAHAFYPSGVKGHTYTSAGDAHFDDNETWVAHGSHHGSSLLAVATHEIGHSLGIGHSTVEDAVMFPYYYNDGSVKFDLHADDIKAVQHLYKKPKPNKQPVRLPDVPHTVPIFTRPSTTSTTTKPLHYVDFCDTTVDALYSQNLYEIYAFKGLTNWGVTLSKLPNEWFKYEITRSTYSWHERWKTIPKEITHIDAIIETEINRKTYLFSGSRFWLFTREFDYLKTNKSGMPLTMLGLPGYISKIDFVFRWSENNKMYLFAGSLYWKIDEYVNKFGYVHDRYPRIINHNWKGLPSRVDTAFTDAHGNTYFIVGKYYYQFDNIRMKVNGPKRPLKVPWLGCIEN